jgi:hypothetical protein
MFSAKVTITLYILVFFELGAVLIISPWNSYWSDNLFLAYVVQYLSAPGLMVAINSGIVRWAVTGLGVVNILLGIWEAFHFKQLVRLLVRNHERPAQETVALSDNRPEGM